LRLLPRPLVDQLQTPRQAIVAVRVARPAVVADALSDRLPELQQLRHRDEVIAALPELADDERQPLGRVPAAAVGVEQNDGTRLDMRQHAARHRVGSDAGRGIAGGDIPLDRRQPHAGHGLERLVVAGPEREAEQRHALGRLLVGGAAAVAHQALPLGQLLAHLLVGDLGLPDLIDQGLVFEQAQVAVLPGVVADLE
jgi:hypothetical protein